MRRPNLVHPNDPEARSLWRISQIYWWCLGAIFVWAALRLRGVGEPLPLHATSFAVVLSLAAANLALRSAIALWRAKGRRVPYRLSWLFTASHLALIAWGLRLTGGTDSGLWIVLFVVVVAETILSPRNESWLVRWCAGIALLAGTWTAENGRSAGYWLDLATRTFFLVVVSMITRRLREHKEARDAELVALERVKDAELATLRAELAAAGERTRLSREIHDGVGNALAAAVLRLEVSARAAEKQPEGVAGDEGGVPALLREEAQALRAAMQQVRDWTFFARPWPTGEADTPFSQLLEREVARLGQRTGLPVTVEGASLLDDLPGPARVAALRITQEALTNAAKYAQASSVRVCVVRCDSGKQFHLSIADDGRGFDPAAAGSGIGMPSMRERAEALGGDLSVEAAPGRGVRITARLPAA